MPDNNTVNVTWTTASESNCDYFSVERSSDGINFQEAGKIKAYGFSSGAREYFMKDYEPYSGSSYYRLKQVDFDGQFTFSNKKPVFLSQQGNGSLVVFPNPAKSQFSIIVEGDDDEEVLIVIRDILGKEYFLKTVIIEGNDEEIKVASGHQLTPGVYIVVASSRNFNSMKKIIIE